MAYDLRLKAYAPNGAQTGVLPTPITVQAGLPLNDVGALTLSYAASAPGASLITQPAEIGVEIQNAAGAWVEPPNCRFLVIGQNENEVDKSVVYSFTCPSYAWRLGKARVLANGLAVQGKRTFSGANAGTVLSTLLNEANARGALAGITYGTFGATLDSNGGAWDTPLTISYDVGLDYLSIILALAQQGVIDFQMVGRDLRVYNGDALAVDKTLATPPVILRKGRDITEAPKAKTLEALANFAVIQGDQDVSVERTNGSATAPWGRWETYISQGGVSDTGTLTVLADGELTRTQQAQEQHTFGISLAAAAHLPLVDYNVGDFVFTDVGVGPVRYRCRQVTLTRDDKGVVGGNLVLNDRILEAEIRLRRKVIGITGGASGAAGVSGTEPTQGPDTRIPSAPTAVTITANNAFLDANGVCQTAVTVSWTPPTTNTDGSTLDDLETYDILWNATTGGARVVFGGTTSNATTVNATLPSGVSGAVTIRAVDRTGNRSANATTATFTTANDTVGFAFPPSSPVVAPITGDLRATWDGLLSNGGAVPADFDRVEVHASTTSAFTPSAATKVGALLNAGYFTWHPPTAYGTPVFVKFVAYDHAGNSSTSAQASATPVRVSGLDIGNDVGTGNINFTSRDIGGITTYFQTAPPTGTLVAGDIWYDTDDAYQMYRYSGSTWVSVRDTTIATAQAAANQANTTANGKNHTYYQGTAPTATAVDDLWFDTANDYRLSRWNGSSWVGFGLGNLAISTLDAGKITSGFIVAARLQAGTITAEKLTVGSFSDNLVPNGGFEDVGAAVDNPNGNGITLNGGGAAKWSGAFSAGCNAYVEAGTRGSGSKYLVLYATGSGVEARAASDYIPVAKSQVYFLSLAASQTSGATGGFYFRLKWFDNNKTFISDYDVASNATLATSSTTSQIVSGQATSPSNAGYVSIWIYNSSPSAGTYVAVDNVVMRAVTVSAQIQDGAIIGQKILAGSISAANAVFANAAIVNANIASIQADKITAGTISASYIVVNTRLTTKSDASQSGARVELDQNGLRAYNAGGGQTIGINADGTGSFTGAIQSGSSVTGATITGGTIQTDSNTSNPRVVISGGSAGQVAFYGGSSAYNTQSNAGLLRTYYQITGTSGTGFTTQAIVQMYSGDYNSYGGASVTVSSYTPQAGESRVDLSATNIYANGGFIASGAISAANGVLTLQTPSSGYSYIVNAPAPGNYAPDAGTGDLVIRNDATGFVRIGTKGGGNNSALVVDGNNTRSYLQGSLSLNNQTLFVSGVADGNHRLLYTSLVDGPYLHGNRGVLLGYVTSPASGNGSAPDGIRVGAVGSTANGRLVHTGSAGNFHIDTVVGSHYIGWFAGSGLHVGNAAQANGIVYCSSTSNTSSGKIKKYVKTLKRTTHGLAAVEALRPVSFQYKASHEPTPENVHDHFGFIAEEVQALFPEVVQEHAYPDGSTVLGMNYNGLIPLLVSAMQEMATNLKDLRAQVAALQSK